LTKFCFILILCLSTAGAFSQDTPDPKAIPFDTISYPDSGNHEILLNRNTFYGSFGSIAVYSTAIAFYERKLTQKRAVSTFLKFGAGPWWGLGDLGAVVNAQYGMLAGRKNHNLELSAGGSLFIGSKLIPLSATIGYRFQKPEAHFIFRIGASWPEAIYVGLGYSF